MRRFNVTGLCVPEEDYMVDISDKLGQIKRLVDNRCYFTINRARQYGKTTTLSMLHKKLTDEYICIRMSFEGVEDECFASASSFCSTFIELTTNALGFAFVCAEYIEQWSDTTVTSFSQLSRHITRMCKNKKVVLMIDEVDKTSNNRVFLHFLSMLRDKFLARKDGMDYTYHSVILVGVYDIKNIKMKLINEGNYTQTAPEGKLYNSPWNIAVSFKVDMSFSSAEIATMLVEYEADHNTGMDIAIISDEIFNFTGGYPFLVSRICQCIDEELNQDWSLNGVITAAQILLRERNTLFDDLFKNLENNKRLYNIIYDILIAGGTRTYSVGNPTVDMAEMYGIIRDTGQGIAVSNRIFELAICDYFISKDEELPNKRIKGVLQFDVVTGGRFDMELCLRKFAAHYAEIFNEHDAEFIEREGRLLFLSYLKPLINGQGFYHIESQFTDMRRMDIVVDFAREQFIIELKLWHGESGHEEAYKQLASYLESKNAPAGYLLTFDFRKGVNKRRSAQWVDYDGRRIFDVVI